MDTVFLALRVLLSLAAVLAVIWYAHRRLTRGGRLPRATKTVNVVTKQAISQKASVVVMDVDGQRFLLGVTDQSVTVLNTSDTPITEQTLAVLNRPAPRAVASPRPTGGAAFARVLAQTQDEDPDTASAEPHADPAPVAYLPGRSGKLDGSILSATTWKRTAAVLRRAR